MRRGHSRDFEPAVDDVPIVASGTVPGVFSSYSWKNVAIINWFGPATVDSVAVFERGCKTLADQCPQGLSSVHFMVPGGRSLPTSEARNELVRVFRTYAPHSAANVVVIPGTGFWAGAMRSLVTAVCVLARSAASPHIFANISEVSEWLPDVHRARTGVELEAPQLRNALEQVSRAAAQRIAGSQASNAAG